MEMRYQRSGKQLGNDAEIFVIVMGEGKAELAGKLKWWRRVGSFGPELSQRFFEKLTHATIVINLRFTSSKKHHSKNKTRPWSYPWSLFCTLYLTVIELSQKSYLLALLLRHPSMVAILGDR